MYAIWFSSWLTTDMHAMGIIFQNTILLLLRKTQEIKFLEQSFIIALKPQHTSTGTLSSYTINKVLEIYLGARTFLNM